MVVVSPIPVQVSDDASRFMEELGIQEPFQRMLDASNRAKEATRVDANGIAG